jgi:hypothetical protein
MDFIGGKEQNLKAPVLLKPIENDATIASNLFSLRVSLLWKILIRVPPGAIGMR